MTPSLKLWSPDPQQVRGVGAVVATAGSAWREWDSGSGREAGPSLSGHHRASSKRETQPPSKGAPPSPRGTPRLTPHSGLGPGTAFPGQFGGTPRPSARWLLVASPAICPPSPHPSSHRVCMTPPLKLLSRPPSRACADLRAVCLFPSRGSLCGNPPGRGPKLDGPGAGRARAWVWRRRTACGDVCGD